VFAVMPCYGAVGGFGLERLAVWSDEDGSHKAKRTESLGDDVGWTSPS
jgi:hypothetical protein